VSAVDELLGLADNPDPIAAAAQIDLPQLQLEAARERFAQLRPRIRLLDQRAADVGIDEIRTPADLVPLLLAHTAYKSYPQSFVTGNRWDRMTQWFAAVSSTSMASVDTDGVTDVDGWIERLEAAGHHVFCSSGTSGKTSFIDQTGDDVERVARLLVGIWGWPNQPPGDRSRPYFSLTPSSGPARVAYAFQAQAGHSGRPDATYTLVDAPIRMGEINDILRLQQAIAAGTASAKDVARFEGATQDRGRVHRHAYERIVTALERHRAEPIIVSGGWPQVWTMVEVARAKGLSDGGFHPDSIWLGSGGTKGLRLPDDYQDQVGAFFGGARRYSGYGMSETSTHSPICDAGRFHVPPWLTLFVLDETGDEIRYAPAGPVTGRAAFWDVAWEGHWGGIISGDWITADYGPCGCGRPGPTVENSVRRAQDVIGLSDDKVSCAGAVEAYVRGAIEVGVERS